MTCVCELAGTEGQVHARAADPRGVVAIDGSDSALGEIFWAEATRSIATSEPAGGERSRDAGPGDDNTRVRHYAGT